MYLNVFSEFCSSRMNIEFMSKTLRVMKIIIALQVIFCLHVSATALSQKISLNNSNIALEQLFKEITKQTGYQFLYTDEVLQNTKPVSVKFSNAPLDIVLKQSLQDNNLDYTISKKTIIIKRVYKSRTQNEAEKEIVDIPITGEVKSDDGTPLEGATILVKGKSNGTKTDQSGMFKINVEIGDILVISYIGYITKEYKVNNTTFIKIEMFPALASGDNVVVIGYGTQKKEHLSGAVSVIKMDDIASSNTTTGNAMKSLQGRVPGVQIFAGGDPNGYTTIRIRGTGTFGDNDPLFIIDGVPTKRNLNELSPADIESIQIMKDASAATIYGSRANGGVIIITTKKAKKGPHIQFGTTFTAQTYKNPVRLLNTEQRGIIQWVAYRNDGLNPSTPPYSFDDHIDENGNWVLDRVKLPVYLDVERTMKPANTDWAGILAQTGLTQNYNITFSNGTDRSNTLLAVDHFDNKGTIRGSRWLRSSVRINSDYNFMNKRFTVGENLFITKLSYRGNINSGIINAARLIQPIVPVHTIDGGYGGPAPGITDHAYNLVRIIETNKDNGNDAVRLLGSAYLDFKVSKNLTYKSNISIDYLGFWQRHLQIPYKEGYVNSTISKVTNDANYSGNWVWNNVINYKIEKKRHDLDLMVGHEVMSYILNTVSASKEQYAAYDPYYMYLGAGEANPQVAGMSSKYSLLSYFGRVNYSYYDKYLLSAVLRRDGSSRFGSNNKYGLFPAVSAGWRVDKEEFFSNLKPTFSELKFRLSWGQTGNQATDDYATYAKYAAIYGTDPSWLDSYSGDAGTAYDIKGLGTGQLPSGYVITQFANPNLKWETATQYNAGLDFGFFNQKLTGTIDVFKKITSDILVRPPAMAVIGSAGSPYLNGATIENTGYEIALAYSKNNKDWSYSISGNLSHYTNIITKLPPGVEASFAGNGKDQTILNRPWGSIYGLVADGLFQNQEEVNTHVIQPGKDIGRIRFKDVNNDGKIDNDDRTWIGNGDPRFSAGLNVQVKWKNIDFSMFWRGVYGNDVINWTKRFTDFYAVDDPFENKGLRTLYAWTPQNSSSTIPALSVKNDNGEDRLSTYYVENGSFTRLQNLEIGYTLPEGALRKIRSSKMRIFLLGQNILWLKSKTYTSSDPEFPNSAYPQPTSVSAGLNIGF